MVRPMICRRVACDVPVRYFKPQGVPMCALEEIALAIDPTVAPLLLALRVATNNLRLDPDDAQLLLTSPLARFRRVEASRIRVTRLFQRWQRTARRLGC